jgi:hypothetical protein
VGNQPIEIQLLLNKPKRSNLTSHSFNVHTADKICRIAHICTFRETNSNLNGSDVKAYLQGPYKVPEKCSLKLFKRHMSKFKLFSILILHRFQPNLISSHSSFK